MRVPRIFQDAPLDVGKTVLLDERATKHLVQVLRLGEDRELLLFNGLGGEYRAKLVEASKKVARAEIIEFIDIEREVDTEIHLAQCVSKGDRFEFAIQKAVELGAQTITPVFSTRSQLKLNNERKDKKIKHWKQVALSACEQSGRTKLLNFHEPIFLSDLLESVKEDSTSKLILDPDGKDPISGINRTGQYCVLIGPEGGFEEQEIKLAVAKGFQSIRLGPQVLRTETAPIAAISAILTLEGVF